MVLRGYMKGSVIMALTYFFSVSKLTYEVRMFFYATLSGINSSLWDTNFILTVMGNFFMLVGPETHMVEIHICGDVLQFQLLFSAGKIL